MPLTISIMYTTISSRILLETLYLNVVTICDKETRPIDLETFYLKLSSGSGSMVYFIQSSQNLTITNAI